MSEVLRFPKPKARHEGKTLCQRGFHQWEVDQQQVFDVKAGRLVTRLRCGRCGAIQVKAI